MNYTYFQHSNCEYFPCHNVDDTVNFNCLFCYCPCYLLDDCPGNPDFSIGIKDCSKCDYPHKAENYYNIVDYLYKKTVEKREEHQLPAKRNMVRKLRS
jgi:Zn-finger protein